jgi:hypothetical protein
MDPALAKVTVPRFVHIIAQIRSASSKFVQASQRNFLQSREPDTVGRTGARFSAESESATCGAPP